MKTNKFFKIIITSLFFASITTFTSCNKEDTPTENIPSNSKYTVSAELVDGEDASGYFVTTDNLLTGSISVVGDGYEGYANLSVSLNGFFYDINAVETTVDKYEFTDEGLVKVDAISYGALFPGTFFRYMQATGTGDILISHSPTAGEVPYMIIDLENFTLEASGNLTLPVVNGYNAIWAQPLVNDGTVYFGTHYGDWEALTDELVTVKYDYPSFTNEEIITSNKSAGSTAGYRGNGSFVTENGDIYQFNLNSSWWTGNQDSTDNNPTVFVKITNGEYDDDYVLDVSATYNENIAIWNAWYAGDNIVYANIVKESDITEWGSLSSNIGKLVEINLSTGSVTELNIPSAPYVNLFKAECIDNGKFYIPVSISGSDANIYEITIGGGANAFQKGATLDGSNVYINAIYNNF